MNIENSVALVTGANRGVGRVYVAELINTRRGKTVEELVGPKIAGLVQERRAQASQPVDFAGGYSSEGGRR